MLSVNEATAIHGTFVGENDGERTCLVGGVDFSLLPGAIFRWLY